MKVGELIEILSQYPHSMPIVVEGYPWDYEDIREICTEKVVKEHESKGYYAEFVGNPEHKPFDAVVIKYNF